MPQDSKPTPSEIRTKIATQRDHAGFTALRERFQNDWDRWVLKEHPVDDGYQSYTSNRHRTQAQKIISWLNESRMTVRTANGLSDQEAGAKLEKFTRGAIRMADHRLERLVQPPIQKQLSAMIALRGWTSGKAVFNNLDDDRTDVEVDIWDPMHIAYETDFDGIVWMARIVHRSPDQLKRLFNEEIEAKSTASEEDSNEGIATYEYMDRLIMAVSYADKWLTKPEDHGVEDPRGMGFCPGWVNYVGSLPLLQPEQGDTDMWQHVGESVYESTREIETHYNEMLSTWKTLTNRSKKQPVIIKSPDGKLRLEEDPWKEGANVHLSEGEEITPLDSQDLLANAEQLTGLVASELQQGSIPDVVFGDLRINISGTAANILRSGARHQVTDRLDTLGTTFTTISNLLRWQYESGEFGTVQFAGNAGELRKFFDEEIEPEEITDAGWLEVRFKNTLGLEDPERFVGAQMLREGPIPLAPDQYIQSEILDVEDITEWTDQIRAQQARIADPKVTAFSFFESLAKEGQDVEAGMYLETLQRMMMSERRAGYMEKLQFQLQIRAGLQALESGDPAAALTLMQEMASQGIGGFISGGGGGGGGGGAAGGGNPAALGMANDTVSSSAAGLDPMARRSTPSSAGSRAAQEETENAQAANIGLTVARS